MKGLKIKIKYIESGTLSLISDLDLIFIWGETRGTWLVKK